MLTSLFYGCERAQSCHTHILTAETYSTFSAYIQILQHTIFTQYGHKIPEMTRTKTLLLIFHILVAKSILLSNITDLECNYLPCQAQSTMRTTYTTAQLMNIGQSLKGNLTWIPVNTLKLLRSLGVCNKPPTHRGKRAGQHLRRLIPTLNGNYRLP